MTAIPDGRVPPAIAWPPIDHSPGPLDNGVLDEFVRRRSRSWVREPVPLPGEVTVLSWFLLLANAALTTWHIGWGTSCDSAPCWLMMLGGRPTLLLSLSLGSVLALLGIVPLTRGLTRAGAASMVLLAGGAIAGFLALLGVVALLVLVAAAVVALVLVVALVVDR